MPILHASDFTRWVRHLLGWGIAFRLIGCYALPVYEDDYFRYLWDGWQFVTTGSPYSMAPAVFFGDAGFPEAFQRILDQINHPGFPTVYGPGLQFFFALAYLIAPGKLLAWKALLLIADMALLLYLVYGKWEKSGHEAKPGRFSLWAALLYGWCPLVIIETGFNAHPDLLGVMFAVGAYAGYRRQAPMRMGIFLALAVSCKVFALILVPFLLWRNHWKAWIIFGGTLLAIYWPFAVQGSWGGIEGVRVMGKFWEFNSMNFALLQAVFSDSMARKVALICTLAGLVLIWEIWRRGHLNIHLAIQVAVGWFLIWSPVINPWYLLWLFPWIIFRPTWTAWTALSIVFTSYLTWQNLGIPERGLFEHPLGVRPLEAGMILAALAADILKKYSGPFFFRKKK